MAASHSHKKGTQDEYTQQLLVLFPRGDPDYFRNCLEHYKENPVERITEKILVDLGGHYPQIPVPQQAHDNRLNACLRILALEIFPSCDISFLREQVLQCQFAHVESVVDALLAKGNKWPERLNYGKMDPHEGIRSEKYKRQAQLQLTKDYPHVWKSSIRAVLAENNWDYIHSFDQLKEMGSGGFWNTLRNLFMHWSAASSVPAHGHISDHHLLEQLKQISQRSIDLQIHDDGILAQRINLTEYTDNQQLMTCDCCYGDHTFEQLLFCTEGSHAFCRECINHYMSEGLFGQGSLRGQSRIQCISSTDDCQGCLPTQTLQHVVSQDVWKAYENALLESCCHPDEQRIQCCGCSYFELDTSTKPLHSMLIYANRTIQHVARWFMVVEILAFSFVACRQDNHSLLFLALSSLSLFTQWVWFDQWDMKNDLEIAYARVARSRRGVCFACQNPACKTITCLDCRRPMRGPHKCWEKETDGLRLYVEKAMADAVKRTVSRISDHRGPFSSRSCPSLVPQLLVVVSEI
ncbi:hypothetical protein [Parasitella parasitica]|uniref:E3 ubiquitin-protein ligase RNF216 RING finger HC subclass domain-containing protein n=1 Tax=Parasitella parasitica TaxID=35722 RepID=A0A0B7NVF4_9FUNG|nr:hypothetical protein [Parasitella parasitica]